MSTSSFRAAEMRLGRRRRTAEVDHLIDRAVRNIEHGRFERSLSALTAAAALVTSAEIYIEHYRASFGDRMMWSPILVTPPVVIASSTDPAESYTYDANGNRFTSGTQAGADQVGPNNRVASDGTFTVTDLAPVARTVAIKRLHDRVRVGRT